MKKIITVLVLFLLINSFSNNAFSQWSYKTVNNQFDEPFKKAITEVNNNGRLCMEVDEPYYIDSIEHKLPLLFLQGTYFCDEETTVDLILVVNGVNIKETFKVKKSNNSQIYFFYSGIWTEEFTKNFKLASKCLIRVNQSHCNEDYYTFKMTNSSKAYDFITK